MRRIAWALVDESPGSTRLIRNRQLEGMGFAVSVALYVRARDVSHQAAGCRVEILTTEIFSERLANAAKASALSNRKARNGEKSGLITGGIAYFEVNHARHRRVGARL